jgi:hypothetical protein
VTRTFVSWAFHGLDVFFAWLLGIVRGIQDVAQTLDWDNCKLPVVDTGLRSYGRCACGDAAQSIPAAAKQQTWEHGAFWCSGFLMLNEADGADLLVWNPFSLDELLRSPGADGGNADAYLACLRSAPAMGGRAACAGKRPVRDALEQQGVEVMQVVARCHANYQQARWDEASTLYALFARDVWARVGLGGRVTGEDLGEASWARDRWTGVRRAMAHAMDRAGSGESALLMSGLSLSVETWACLDDALRGGDLAHSCWRLAARAPNREFAYGEAPRAEKEGSSFADVDACRAFSGAEWADAKSALAGGLPRTMWSGSSSTREPVARLHPVVEDLATAQAEAAKEMRAYVDAHIAPTFERLGDSKLRDALEQQLSVQTWSVEGDSLHQLVDCVFLGPYAAAELAPNLHDGGARLPAPLYHRGRADSRAFASSGDTGGSAARRAFVQEARAELAQHGASVVASEAWRHFDSLRAMSASCSPSPEPPSQRADLCVREAGAVLGAHPARHAGGAAAGRGQAAGQPAECVGGGSGAGVRGRAGRGDGTAAGERFEFASYVEAHGHLFKPASFRASIQCCVEQAQAGLGCADLVFTADAPFERREWDIGDTVLAGALSRVANSSVWARMLHGEGWRSDAGAPEGPQAADAAVADAYRPPARLRTEERSRLQEAQLFAPAHRVPVRAYDETEEALGGEPLWQACNARVAGLYATLPWTRAADDADTTLGEIREARDAAELLGAVLDDDPSKEGSSLQRVPGAGIHALEGAVAKLLTRAHALSAGFYTHAHRYVPSDSVWCEKDAAAWGARAQPPRARAAPAAAGSDASLPGLDPAELARIRGPGAGELLYPAAALDHCACGWQGAGGAAGADLCYVPAEACAGGAAALAARDAARDAAAPNATDARLGGALRAGLGAVRLARLAAARAARAAAGRGARRAGGRASARVGCSVRRGRPEHELGAARRGRRGGVVRGG